jgi:hypothetical protein
MPGATSAWRVNLNEERQESLHIIEGKAVLLTVKPKEIITLEFE